VEYADFKTLKLQCAKCAETNYDKCLTCETYKTLNVECAFCGQIGGVISSSLSTAKGIVKRLVCSRCLAMVT